MKVVQSFCYDDYNRLDKWDTTTSTYYLHRYRRSWGNYRRDDARSEQIQRNPLLSPLIPFVVFIHLQSLISKGQTHFKCRHRRPIILSLSFPFEGIYCDECGAPWCLAYLDILRLCVRLPENRLSHHHQSTLQPYFCLDVQYAKMWWFSGTIGCSFRRIPVGASASRLITYFYI